MHFLTRITAAGFAAWAWLAVPNSRAAAQSPRQVVSYPLRLIDLTIAADTVGGLQLVAVSGAGTHPADPVRSLVWLRFDPDSVLDWLNGAFVALRTPAPTGAAKGIQWSRTLLPLGGKGGLALGRSRKNQTLEQKRWLAIGDSALGWQAEISGAEADSLLQLFLALGTTARLDTTSAAPSDSAQVDVPARVASRLTPGATGLAGRVLTQFVVGTDGRVEPGSIAVLMASDPRLVQPVLAAVREATFHPAERGGQPVRQVVRQQFYWSSRP